MAAEKLKPTPAMRQRYDAFAAWVRQERLLFTEYQREREANGYRNPLTQIAYREWLDHWKTQPKPLSSRSYSIVEGREYAPEGEENEASP